MNQLAIILDFEGRHSHLFARRALECGVYCEILPHTTPLERIRAKKPMAIILTGGSRGVYEQSAPLCSPELLELGVPILGICYGAQVIAALAGGEASRSSAGEIVRAEITFLASPLFSGLAGTLSAKMSHRDSINKLPPGYSVIAKTGHCPHAAIENADARIYAVQFHPEMEHVEQGKAIIENFLMKISGFSSSWDMRGYVERTVESLREKIGNSRALCAISGGVDSTVSAIMTHRAIGDRLTCIFVDHGLLRKNEADEVEALCRGKFNMNLIRVDAADRFLDKLVGITDPELKRKIIGEEFIRVFEDQAKKIGEIDYLVQGTIYPDIIESGNETGAVIKSHHNVGGLPDIIKFKEVIEPLKFLFKDEVRQAGLELGIDEQIVRRQPFPGPGLAVRVLGDITREKLSILREADAIFREEIKNAGLDREISQYFAVLTSIRSVGIIEDSRTYDYTIALRAVNTSDFMTADYIRLPYEVLDRVSVRIINEAKNVSRIVYDITSKPPSTIEWE